MPQIDFFGSAAASGGAAGATRQQALAPALVTLLDRLAGDAALEAGVIAWGCPVPAFGDPAVARVATLGLNPSNREFVDDEGRELAGDARRFPTLASLDLLSWDAATAYHLDCILASCRDYFACNPYDGWFRRLDAVVSATGASYYDPASPACHLDLIPYATVRKWTDLTTRQRASLLRLAGDTLALILRRSAVRVLILNGQSVVSHFEEATGVTLARTEMAEWALARRSGAHVPGYAYQGCVDAVSGHQLPGTLRVLGFNHNLQSSFGVTSRVVEAVRTWVGHAAGELRLRATALA